jgi:hypothetical protein
LCLFGSPRSHLRPDANFLRCDAQKPTIDGSKQADHVALGSQLRVCSLTMDVFNARDRVLFEGRLANVDQPSRSKTFEHTTAEGQAVPRVLHSPGLPVLRTVLQACSSEQLNGQTLAASATLFLLWRSPSSDPCPTRSTY